MEQKSKTLLKAEAAKKRRGDYLLPDLTEDDEKSLDRAWAAAAAAGTLTSGPVQKNGSPETTGSERLPLAVK